MKTKIKIAVLTIGFSVVFVALADGPWQCITVGSCGIPQKGTYDNGCVKKVCPDKKVCQVENTGDNYCSQPAEWNNCTTYQGVPTFGHYCNPPWKLVSSETVSCIHCSTWN